MRLTVNQFYSETLPDHLHTVPKGFIHQCPKEKITNEEYEDPILCLDSPYTPEVETPCHLHSVSKYGSIRISPQNMDLYADFSAVFFPQSQELLALSYKKTSHYSDLFNQYLNFKSFRSILLLILSIESLILQDTAANNQV